MSNSGSFQSMLMRLGLSIRIQTKVTKLDGTDGQIIGGDIPTNVGLIYGVVYYADTVGPKNEPLITTTQAMNLWLNVFDGETLYGNPMRLDDFLNVFAGNPLIRSEKYTPVMYHGSQFRFDQSNYSNPTGIIGVNVRFNYYYITIQEHNMLVEHGLIFHPEHKDNAAKYGKPHKGLKPRQPAPDPVKKEE